MTDLKREIDLKDLTDNAVLSPPQKQLPGLWVRFYGRFVFVPTREKQRDGTEQLRLTVLAVDVGYAKTESTVAPNLDEHNITPGDKDKEPKDRHHVLMTVLEKNVVRKKDDGDWKSATLRLIGTEIAPFQGASYIWDIDGCSVDIPGSGGVREPLELIPLANLQQLSKGKQLNQVYLKHPPNKPVVTAIIEIHAGSQFAWHLPTKKSVRPGDTKYEFVSANTGQVDHAFEPKPYADMVQITMDLPPEGVKLNVKKRETNEHDTIRTLHIVAGPAPIQNKTDPVVVISFSNLCGADVSDGNGPYKDEEFATFYKLLVEMPLDVLIPQLADEKTRNIPPFGDCFLGATFSE